MTGSFTEAVVIWYLPLLMRNLLTISLTATFALYEKYRRESLFNVGDNNWPNRARSCINSGSFTTSDSRVKALRLSL